MNQYSTIDEYIALQPAEARPHLEAVRAQLRALLPDATEAIAYGMPTYKRTKRNIIHFGAFKNHMRIFPGAQVCEELAAEYPDYVKAKGTIHLPLDGPFPHPFIDLVVAQRLKQYHATGK